MGILELFLQSPSALLGALVVLLILCLVSSSSFSSRENRRDPPGPKPLPLLGNLLQLNLKKPIKSFLKFSKIYGSVFTIYLGPKKNVILAGYKTVKEAFVDHADVFGDRGSFPFIHDFNQGHGIIWANGDSWKEMRRFALMNLKNFGMGKKACEDKIIKECGFLIEGFKKFNGEAFETSQPLHNAVSNIICSMVYGSRFEYDDPVFSSFVNAINSRVLFLDTTPVQLYNLFPWIGKWIVNMKEFQHLEDILKKHNMEMFSHLKKTLNPEMCRGYVDAFLVQKQKLEESGNTNSHFHDENLLISVVNLFSAGTDTTANTLNYGLQLMAHHPKIQDQVQEELSRVIGTRQVHVEDRKNLPFTYAVIHEIQRLTNIAPLGLPHKTTQDITFHGYFIKKGTTVYGNMTSVLFDESEWERPHNLYPAHFLDKDGKFVMRAAFMPFFAGRRACPGEALAKMELLIFFCTLLQHFRFCLPAGVSVGDMDLTPNGYLHNIALHELRAVPRM